MCVCFFYIGVGFILSSAWNVVACGKTEEKNTPKQIGSALVAFINKHILLFICLFLVIGIENEKKLLNFIFI